MFSREEMSSKETTKVMVLSRSFKRGKKMKIPQRLFREAMEPSWLP
jgi:hypothetical protein